MANRADRRRNLARMSRAERQRFLATKAEKLTGGVWLTPKERRALHSDGASPTPREAERMLVEHPNRLTRPDERAALRSVTAWDGDPMSVPWLASLGGAWRFSVDRRDLMAESPDRTVWYHVATWTGPATTLPQWVPDAEVALRLQAGLTAQGDAYAATRLGIGRGDAPSVPDAMKPNDYEFRAGDHSGDITGVPAGGRK